MIDIPDLIAGTLGVSRGTAYDMMREALVRRLWEGYVPEPVKQQEPVARQYQNRDGVWKDFISEKHYKDTLEDGSWPIRNLYTSPQPAQWQKVECPICGDMAIATDIPAAQRPWLGLTDEEIETVWKRVQADDFHDCVQPFARAIEAKLKEKNT